MQLRNKTHFCPTEISSFFANQTIAIGKWRWMILLRFIVRQLFNAATELWRWWLSLTPSGWSRRSRVSVELLTQLQPWSAGSPWADRERQTLAIIRTRSRGWSAASAPSPGESSAMALANEWKWNLTLTATTYWWICRHNEFSLLS